MDINKLCTIIEETFDETMEFDDDDVKTNFLIEVVRVFRNKLEKEKWQ